jgi:hypothetical protein
MASKFIQIQPIAHGSDIVVFALDGDGEVWRLYTTGSEKSKWTKLTNDHKEGGPPREVQPKGTFV